MLSFKNIPYTILFFISACGFSPVYNENNTPKLVQQISIQEPSSQNEFIFYSNMVDRFGDLGDRYILNYTISTSDDDRALDYNGNVHRIEIYGSAVFNLKDLGNGTEILSDKVEVYLSYSNSGSTAAILNAKRNTNKQLIILLADKVADRISLAIVQNTS